MARWMPRPMPALSATQVAFSHGGELWIASREGGDAQRLTTGAGVPITGGTAFSPDGRWLAYTATYGGDADVAQDVAQGAERFDDSPDFSPGDQQCRPYQEKRDVYGEESRRHFQPYDKQHPYEREKDDQCAQPFHPEMAVPVPDSLQESQE